MSLLLSTGIWGFITSAAKKSGGYVSTFVSGLSGWIINHNGDAEFKSIYARDKIVTNEYVYNRIRVTEDEEVVTSNGKILSATDNEDGTYTVYIDLREGDVNPFAEGDLLQGYYHSTGNSGVIYAVQKLTVIEDPNTDDQSMLVTCENGSLPYKYMIIVRIGNTINLDRQSFIKISSRTNCQYFHDGINSFAALDNPDNVKCVLGKADMGLVPSWAQAAIEGVRKWFGLIADGVILRGIFILKSSGTTVEEELDGMANKFVDIETSFEIREGQISSKVLLAETYAENAENSATSASGSALIATAKASEAKQTADGFNQTVTEKLTEVNNAALRAENAASDASDILVSVTEKESSVTQTADGFVQTVTAVTKQAVDDAVDGADQAITDKVSTVVEQSATQWKVEVLNGEDTVMAAINADASGVKIQGDKVEIDGLLLAEKIAATDITTSRLTIGAGARIGDLYIYDGGIYSTPTGDVQIAVNYMRADLDGFKSKFYQVAMVPHPTKPGEFIEDVRDKEAYMTPGKMYARNSKDAPYTAEAGNGRTALDLVSGFIAGMSVKTRQITGSSDLTHADGNISCYNSDPITVTLPASPQLGKQYTIRRGNASVTISGNGKTLHWGTSSGATLVMSTLGDIFFLFWDGTYWCVK